MTPDDPRHGSTAGYAQKCRCPRCRAAQAAYGRAHRHARRDAVAAGVAAVPHGTATGYTNWDCRCDACSAHARDDVKRRLARVAAGELAIPHGTSRGYTAFECRCPACCAARKVTRRAERVKRQAARADRGEQVAA